MAFDEFKIYIDRLRHGNVEKIEENYPIDFLQVHEEELHYEGHVHVRGEVYLAEQNLILHLSIDTTACIPCLVCNEEVKVPIQISNLYHSEPLSTIKGGVYDMREMLRENVLLETPSFAECNQNRCDKRENVKKFLRKTGKDENEADGYHPFANL